MPLKQQATRIGNYSEIRQLRERGADRRRLVLMSILGRFRVCRCYPIAAYLAVRIVPMNWSEDEMMHDGWMNWGQGGWSGMWFGPLFLVGVLLLVVGLIFALTRARSGGTSGAPNSTRTPRQILDERFARGEINREEFEQRRKAVEA